jgi:hypothetical protein
MNAFFVIHRIWESSVCLFFAFQTFEEAERCHWESMESEWEREKQKILNALVSSTQDMMDLPPEEVTNLFLIYEHVEFISLC